MKTNNKHIDLNVESILQRWKYFFFALNIYTQSEIANK